MGGSRTERRMDIPATTSRPPFPASSLNAWIVILRWSDPSQMLRSVNEVSRSFSSASLALEIISRRKISLDGVNVNSWPFRGDSLLRIKTTTRMKASMNILRMSAHTLLTCRWRSFADEQRHSRGGQLTVRIYAVVHILGNYTSLYLRPHRPQAHMTRGTSTRAERIVLGACRASCQMSTMRVPLFYESKERVAIIYRGELGLIYLTRT